MAKNVKTLGNLLDQQEKENQALKDALEDLNK